MSARLDNTFEPKRPLPARPAYPWPFTIDSAHISGRPPRRRISLPAPPTVPKKI
ncbi:MAG: hypothetical protein ACPGVU_06290 [Limisphaerales bacterium]